MSLQIKILVLCGIVVLLFWLMSLVRNQVLNLKYAFPWMFLAVGVGLFTFFDSLTSQMARLLGIEVPSNMIFFLGFCFTLAIVFCLTLALSRVSGKVKRLTQECGLLSEQLEKLERQLKQTELFGEVPGAVKEGRKADEHKGS